jgi:glutathione S-transferase
MRIIGSYVSPYVRKVLACLALKGLSYEIDPIVPFYGDEEFERLSPLRRIPVLIDGDLVISDSSVICAYLDEAYPGHPLFPAGPADRARARWLEEFADTRMGEVLIWRLFNQLAIKPAVWGEKADRTAVDKTIAEDLPAVLDYLESQVPASGYLFGEIGVADIALSAFFRNAGFVRFGIDAARWPRTAAFVAGVLDHPALAHLRPFEEASIKVPVVGQREAVKAVGAPVTAQTCGTATPRPGVMAI